MKDSTEFLRQYPSSTEVVQAWDALIMVLETASEHNDAYHIHPLDQGVIDERRTRLDQACQAARVQLAMMRGRPAPTTPKSLHPPGTQHAGSSRHG
jgi:hypothetical protein